VGLRCLESFFSCKRKISSALARHTAFPSCVPTSAVLGVAGYCSLILGAAKWCVHLCVHLGMHLRALAHVSESLGAFVCVLCGWKGVRMAGVRKEPGKGDFTSL
jgi:hypothetical protein